MSGLELQQNIVICVLFSVLGGILEVFATAFLAYPAARICQGKEWTDNQLKACLAANIILQVLSSLSGNLFATWYGPVSIVGPIFFAAQLLANLLLFWIVLGIEAFSREMQIGTYIIIVSIVLLLVNGPSTQTYDQTFEELILQPAAATWSVFLVAGMSVAGGVVLKSRLLNIQQFEAKNVVYKFTILLIARACAFSLNLTTSKAFLIQMSPGGYVVSIIIKIVSGAIYTMSIVVQSTTVEQRTFVPLNSATTIFINAVTGMLIWEDWRVVQSWAGYVCVFFLMALGCTLLLGDLSLLQEAAPETFNGARFAMTIRSNRQRLLDNLRSIANQAGGLGVIREDEEGADDEEAVSARNSSSIRQQDAWTAIYETSRAAPKNSLTLRTKRRRRDKAFLLVDGTSQVISNSPIQSQPCTVSIQAESNETSSNGEMSLAPTSTSDDFKYTKGTCALSWWRPIKLLAEGSISDIHLVKRRKEFLPVKYKEKREVMALAKKKTLFSRRQLSVDEIDDDDDVMVLKSIIKSHIGDEDVLNEMRSEILVMSHLKHPNIVRLYEAYERKRHVYLVMEYCPGGNLTNKDYTEEQSAVVMRKILSALAYMHSKGITHRDIKLENIMIDRFGEVKLIDFGLATKYQSDEYTDLTETVGTLYSMAPQVLEGTGYDNKADLWSIGVVTYLLLSKAQPFWGPLTPMTWTERRRVMIDLILKCQYAPMLGENWRGVSLEAIQFVETLLQYEPEKRPSAEEALQSKWIQMYEESSKLPLAVDGPEASVMQEEMDKSAHHATEFRRKTLQLVSTRLNRSQIDDLQQKLERNDATGNGFVDLDVLLSLVEESGCSAVTDSDVALLKEDLSLAGAHRQLEYIDFMTEVHRSRKRNIMDKLAAALDGMDGKGTRQVPISSILTLVEDDVVPVELQQEFKQTFQFLREFYRNDESVSTLNVLNWFEKRLTRKEFDSIEH